MYEPDTYFSATKPAFCPFICWALIVFYFLFTWALYVKISKYTRKYRVQIPHLSITQLQRPSTFCLIFFTYFLFYSAHFFCWTILRQIQVLYFILPLSYISKHCKKKIRIWHFLFPSTFLFKRNSILWESWKNSTTSTHLTLHLSSPTLNVLYIYIAFLNMYIHLTSCLFFAESFQTICKHLKTSLLNTLAFKLYTTQGGKRGEG